MGRREKFASVILLFAITGSVSASIASLGVHESDGDLLAVNNLVSPNLDSSDSLGLQLGTNLGTGGFYYNLKDEEVESDAYFLPTIYYPDGTNIKTVECYVTNTTTYKLENASWAIQFAYYPAIGGVFSYENSDHTWYLHRGESNEKWTRSYGVMNQYELLSMDRNVTEAPLFRTYWGATAYLAETDEVTLISFGDLNPGETVYRKLYLKANFSGLGIRGYLLTTTPEPTTLLLLGLGAVMLRRRKQ